MSDIPVKVSFYQKQPTTCPVCSTDFRKEEMLSGGGRLIAKTITDELRRIYVPSKKISELYPLIYPVTVCPECLYSTYEGDFPSISGEQVLTALSQKTGRVQGIKLIFPVIDFKKPRNLFSGTASYLLAISCYSFHQKDIAPTFKKAISSLRAAWLFDDLHKKYPGQNFDRLKVTMYKKAIGYYEKSINYAQTGEEAIDSIKNFGPDLDKNYGYEGALFLSTLLLYKYGEEKDKRARIEKLERAKRSISKVFGSGRSSKSKPSFILDLSKELYDRITKRIEELSGS